VLFTGCEMVREVFPQRLPDSLIAVLEESPEAVKVARENVERLLIGGVGAAQNPEIWGFYLQTETKMSNRWRRRLMYLVPTAADYQWIECHRIPRGFAPLVRPFRLLAKHGWRRAWRTAFPPSV